MNLGFYYHIPLHSSKEGLKIPAYLGVFLDSLANEVNTLTLFMHEANAQEALHCDYILKGENIRYITIGIKRAAWDRFLWPGKTLSKIRNTVATCNTVIVRAPSPLAPAFYDEFHKITKVAYLVVGDYNEGAKHLDQPWWRKIPISILSNRNDRQLSVVLAHTLTLVNSTALFNKYKTKVKNLHEVKTTTLSSSDFFERTNTCEGNKIKILYAGGLYLAKGLIEFLEAGSIVIQKFKNVSLHFVGGDYTVGEQVKIFLKQRAKELGIEQQVSFHGYKTTGADLNKIYRMADIYAIPSYHEGFPRTIWEAMANSLPVIATTVGSIPYFLESGTNAILIEPKNVKQLAESIELIINNQDLRKKLIHNGFLLAKENTLELQTKKMVQVLKDNFIIN
jgi:glycosyltransferase involved in cell wall biosynthesis